MKLGEIETHCHTGDVSICGRVPAEEVVRLYHDLGYHGLFITDHFKSEYFDAPEMLDKSWEEKVDLYMQGYRRAKAAGDRLGIHVFFGMEVTPDNSPYDFLVYGADEAFLKEHGPIYRLEIQDLFSLMDAHGKLVFQAHPYRYDLEPEDPAYYHGLEIFNAHPRHHSRNNLALQFAYEHHLWTISGSDTHRATDAGRSGVMMPESVQSEEAFVEYYRQHGSPELIIIFG